MRNGTKNRTTGEHTMDHTQNGPRGLAPRGLALAALGVSTALAGCSFDVTNPGPVEDDFLNRVEAHAAVIAGTARMFADGLDNIAMTGAAVSRELFPSGSTGSFGISNFQQEGFLFYDDTHVAWTEQQRARFMAEDAFRRFGESEEVDVNSYDLAAEAALLAGYANRLLGENFCEAVLPTEDGTSSGALPYTAFLERAEDWFTQAITIATAADATDIASAARAGRASIRVGLGDWTGAVSDAQAVPDGFVFQAGYNQLDSEQFNRLYWAGAAQPYRSVSAWNTQWEEYYATTGDPRVSWFWRDADTGETFDAFEFGLPANEADAGAGDAAVSVVEDSLPNGLVPHFVQTKYPQEASNINLSSKWEMNLIEAEAQLRNGNVAPAIELMNLRRADLGIDLLDSAGLALDDAWTLLRRERGIELWMEARRMWDLRRWEMDNTPGELHFLEDKNDPRSFLRADQTLCYPIPRAEREANPALPLNP